MVKLIMTWDIQDDKERACVEFMVSELGPGLQRLGLKITEAWYTQVGTGPQITVAGTIATDAAARTLLDSADFERLRDRLLAYVEDFRYRLVRATNGGMSL